MKHGRMTSIDQADNGSKVIAGNATMIDAYTEDIPGNSKTFPDDSSL
jgi:hypothetical protein